MMNGNCHVRFRGTLRHFASCRPRFGLQIRGAACQNRVALFKLARSLRLGRLLLPYAWDGYIYSYPWDDRPSALAYARRHRHRY
jgi:hypothetical protein